jgi:hypothetical protein
MHPTHPKTVDRVWIGNLIYRTLTTRDYKNQKSSQICIIYNSLLQITVHGYTVFNWLWHALSFLSLHWLHQCPLLPCLCSQLISLSSDCCLRIKLNSRISSTLNDYSYHHLSDCLCGLVVRVPGYRSRGPGSISGATRLSWEVVGLERGPLSLVNTIEELRDTPLSAKAGSKFTNKLRSLGQDNSLMD